MECMPVLFVGHGSPMNAIEENQYSTKWKEIGHQLPKPTAILSVSAHWFTQGTLIADTENPKMIYDMYGFPDELYRVVYSAPGAPALAGKTMGLLDNAKIDNTWGLDHGTWSVLRWLFREADVPVFQLSVDRHALPETHYAIGQKLKVLRDQGVLIMGSGNVVHNLRRVNWQMNGGYPWAEEFDSYIMGNMKKRNHNDIIHYERAGEAAALSFTSLDHFAPLLYVIGASDKQDHMTIFNDTCVMGAMSMTGYLFS